MGKLVSFSHLDDVFPGSILSNRECTTTGGSSRLCRKARMGSEFEGCLEGANNANAAGLRWPHLPRHTAHQMTVKTGKKKKVKEKKTKKILSHYASSLANPGPNA